MYDRMHVYRTAPQKKSVKTEEKPRRERKSIDLPVWDSFKMEGHIVTVELGKKGKVPEEKKDPNVIAAEKDVITEKNQN